MRCRVVVADRSVGSMLARNMIIFGELTFSVSLSGNSWRTADRMRLTRRRHSSEAQYGDSSCMMCACVYVCVRVYVCARDHSETRPLPRTAPSQLSLESRLSRDAEASLGFGANRDGGYAVTRETARSLDILGIGKTRVSALMT